MNTLHLDASARAVLQVGDLHVQSTELRYQRRVLDWLPKMAAEKGVTASIFCGDLAGQACPHVSRPAEREAIRETVKPMTALGPVIVIQGNHDLADDWRWLGEIPGVHYIERPTVCLFDQDATAVLAMPYPSRSWIATERGSADEIAQVLEGALRAMFAGFRVACDDYGAKRRMVSAHINTRGAYASTGQPLIGTDFEVPAPELLSAAPLALLNHIHKAQEPVKGVIHVGSPWPTTYGEEEDKRVVIARPDIDGWTVDSIATPCVVRRTAQVTWKDDGGWAPESVRVDDATLLRVRFIYPETVDAAPTLATARDIYPGAADYKVERHPVISRQARAPEVVEAKTPRDRFVAFEVSEGRDADANTMLVVDECIAEATA